MAFADRDESVGSRGGEVVGAQVAGIEKHDPDRGVGAGGGGGGGLVGVDELGGGHGLVHDGGECGGVAGVVSY